MIKLSISPPIVAGIYQQRYLRRSGYPVSPTLYRMLDDERGATIVAQPNLNRGWCCWHLFSAHLFTPVLRLRNPCRIWLGTCMKIFSVWCAWIPCLAISFGSIWKTHQGKTLKDEPTVAASCTDVHLLSFTFAKNYAKHPTCFCVLMHRTSRGAIIMITLILCFLHIIKRGRYIRPSRIRMSKTNTIVPRAPLGK